MSHRNRGRAIIRRDAAVFGAFNIWTPRVYAAVSTSTREEAALSGGASRERRERVLRLIEDGGPKGGT